MNKLLLCLPSSQIEPSGEDFSLERIFPWRRAQEAGQHPPEMLQGEKIGSKFVFCNTEGIN